MRHQTLSASNAIITVDLSVHLGKHGRHSPVCIGSRSVRFRQPFGFVMSPFEITASAFLPGTAYL
jgi:hypothetical protein